VRAAARLYATGGNGAIYYGLGVTEHSQGSTMVMGMANLAMLTGNLGRQGVGVNPLRGQNNVQGSCDMGSFPHELPGYRHVGRPRRTRHLYEALWGHHAAGRAGLRIPNMFDSAHRRHLPGLFVQGEDIAQSDPNTAHVEAALRSLELVVVQDLFLNETAGSRTCSCPARRSWRRTARSPTPSADSDACARSSPRRVGKDEWQVVCRDRHRDGLPDVSYADPGRDHGRDRGDHPYLRRCVVRPPRRRGLDAVARATRRRPTRHADHARGRFVRGKAGHLMETVYVPTTERTTRRFPLILTTGRILSQYNVGAQTRRTPTSTWHPKTSGDPPARRARCAASATGDLVELQLAGRHHHAAGEVSERMQPGVVYTTFHHPVSGANVVTTENSDWATNCPEYKVTAVQVGVANAREAEQQEHAGVPLAEAHR
jgi:formate dehydrogenase major subunit